MLVVPGLTATDPTLYLDCEFTDLLQPELLSLGFVSSHGEEHYAELDLGHPSSAAALAGCSDFVRHGPVLEQWGRMPGCAMTYAHMGQRTAHWLLAQSSPSGQPVHIAYDYPVDYELLETLLRDVGRWKQVRAHVRPLYLREHLDRLDANLAAEAMFDRLRPRGLHRHHALADAHALRAAHHALLTGKYLP